MRYTTRTAALALGWVGVGAADASAAWNNVFQTTCNGSSSRSRPTAGPAGLLSTGFARRSRMFSGATTSP